MAVRQRVIAAGTDLVNGGTGVRFEVEGDGRRIAAFAIRYDGRVHPMPVYLRTKFSEPETP